MFSSPTLKIGLLIALGVFLLLFFFPNITQALPIVAAVYIILFVAIPVCFKQASVNLGWGLSIFGVIFTLLTQVPGIQFTIPILNWPF